MGSTNKTGNQPDRKESEKGSRRYHFEFTLIRMVVYGFCLVVALSWMFVFGVLVGRGVPLVDVNSKSFQAELLRFLGLGREAASPVEHAADTWDPKAVAKSLEYYENLTQKNAAGQAKGVAASAVRQKNGAKDSPSAQKPKVLPLPPQQDGEKALPVAAKETPAVPGKGGEHFTLLVVSLKDQENAQRMVEQLRTRGYAPRMETIDLNTAGRWNRVLVGSFRNREEALRFAAEFNRKEHMEGLVIRESQ